MSMIKLSLMSNLFYLKSHRRRINVSIIDPADDWIIYISHKLPRVAETRLKKAEKTKSVFIHRRNRVLGRTPIIRIWIKNEEIEMTKHHRILRIDF
jgi:hypothetical protein